jgi:hypothetical protein
MIADTAEPAGPTKVDPHLEYGYLHDYDAS